MAEDKKNKGHKPTEAEIAARKAAKRAKVETEVEVEDKGKGSAAAEPAPPARLIAHYREKVVPALQEKLGMSNLDGPGQDRHQRWGGCQGQVRAG
jgi:hypothetical protein